MTNEDLSRLQEEPAGKPWESEDVRTWEPRPFDLVEYNKFAAREARDAIID